jgi:hypothetical protein
MVPQMTSLRSKVSEKSADHVRGISTEEEEIEADIPKGKSAPEMRI